MLYHADSKVGSVSLFIFIYKQGRVPPAVLCWVLCIDSNQMDLSGVAATVFYLLKNKPRWREYVYFDFHALFIYFSIMFIEFL